MNADQVADRRAKKFRKHKIELMEVEHGLINVYVDGARVGGSYSERYAIKRAYQVYRNLERGLPAVNRKRAATEYEPPEEPPTVKTHKTRRGGKRERKKVAT